MILRRLQVIGATTPGSHVDRTRGGCAVPSGYAKKKRRPLATAYCTRCETKLAADQLGEMCTPCQLAPRCPVCEGHGRTGRSRLDVCYRCHGSGIQPILSAEVKRRRAA